MTSETQHVPPKVPTLNRFFSFPISRAQFASGRRIAIVYISALTVAELLTTFLNPAIGVIGHVIILITLLFHATFVSETVGYQMLIALLITPLIRIVSLSLPLFQFDLRLWYVIVSIPLYSASFAAMKLLNFSRVDVGLTVRKVPIQIAVILVGIILGLTEFNILHTTAIVSDLSLSNVLIGGFSLSIGTGLMEELVFRGIIQHAAEKSLGANGSVVFSATVFMIMHIGWQSYLDLAFVFVVGLFWGYVFLKTRSIIGIAISHSLTNILLFIFLPLLVTTTIIPSNAELAGPQTYVGRPGAVITQPDNSTNAADGSILSQGQTGQVDQNQTSATSGYNAYAAARNNDLPEVIVVLAYMLVVTMSFTKLAARRKIGNH